MEGKDICREKILVVDDEPGMADMVRIHLERKRYDVFSARDGKEGIEKAQGQSPDLILLDILMPDINGYEVCQKLKEDISTSLIPIIILTARGEVEDRITGFQVGADDYLIKPFHPQELRIRIETALERVRRGLGTNPLTKLPGNVFIQKEVERRIKNREDFVIAHLDVNHFKSCNDLYGYHRGDKIIQKLGEIILESIRCYGNRNDFIGHIGGDDFIFISTRDRVEDICSHIVKTFDETTPTFYEEVDRRRGYVQTKDRQGNIQRFPLLTLSIAAVPHHHDVDIQYASLVDHVAGLKNYVKSLPGSNYRISRRRT